MAVLRKAPEFEQYVGNRHCCTAARKQMGPLFCDNLSRYWKLLAVVVFESPVCTRYGDTICSTGENLPLNATIPRRNGSMGFADCGALAALLVQVRDDILMLPHASRNSWSCLTLLNCVIRPFILLKSVLKLER
ncbi:hypothetical protein FHL15_010128 [Xylaria flabelliformis]|uniref:Uncharacterized protein n=1 Tax=Xylaria flabelliformis TaxID=2512241 RepID=A0A553HM73_9PEZI|nr:hypothetical protein FHL15_010128 [Xylaria flabelliformis]